MLLSGNDVSLIVTIDLPGSSFDVSSIIAWRPEMPYLTIQSMMTMQYVPQLDRKLVRYGVSWLVAIATSMIGVVAYA